MDKRRIELQIRAVLVTFRIESLRRETPVMEAFHDRARSILDALWDEVRPYPELEARLQEALEELEAGRGMPEPTRPLGSRAAD